MWQRNAIHAFMVVLLLFAAFNSVVFNFFEFLDIGRKEKVQDRSCFVKKGIVGAEDITDWNHHCILASSSDRINLIKNPPDQTHISQGAIWKVCGMQQNMIENEDYIYQQKLEIQGWPEGIAFQPHGVDVLRDEKLLYVINHAMKQGGERIEVFSVVTDDRLEPLSLKYLHSITSEDINKEAYGAFNAIAVASHGKFYITRHIVPLEPYGTNRNKWVEMVYDNIFKPTGVYWIEYNENTKDILFKEVQSGFAQANGIAFDLKKNHVWIADGYAKTVSKYERNLTDNELIKHNEVKVGYIVDNLKYCEFNDRLYTAGISSLWKVWGAMNPPENARGHHEGVYSAMIELGIPEYGMGVKRTLALTDKLAPLSNALRIGDFMIGGSPIQDGIIVCKINKGYGEIEPEIAHSVDFEVHKHMEL